MGDSGWVNGSFNRLGRKMLISSTHVAGKVWTLTFRKRETLKQFNKRCIASWSCYCSLFFRKYLEERWASSGRGSGVNRPKEQLKALPALASQPDLGGVTLLLTSPPGALLGPWVLSWTSEPESSVVTRVIPIVSAQLKHRTQRNTHIWCYLSHLGSSRRHALGDISLKGSENQTNRY